MEATVTVSGLCKCLGSQRIREDSQSAVGRRKLFAALDKCEDRLSKHRYIIGNQLTEADVRLFQTLIRFDEVSSSPRLNNSDQPVDYSRQAPDCGPKFQGQQAHLNTTCVQLFSSILCTLKAHQSCPQQLLGKHSCETAGVLTERGISGCTTH